ncbi:hypothetical protein ACHAWC_008967 [Mediolabrus comicus]
MRIFPVLPTAAAVLFIIIFSVLVQLRLSALNLSPVSFILPDLPSVPEDDRLDNSLIEKIGENDLVYPEAIVVDPEHEGQIAFVSLGDGRIIRIEPADDDDKSWNELTWRTVVRTGEDDARCGSGGPSDESNMESKCGRPLGLWLTKQSSVDPNFPLDGSKTADEDETVLLVADAYKGLLMISGIHGDAAKVTTLATRADSTTKPDYDHGDHHDIKVHSDPPDYQFSFLNGIVQTPNGDVYFTETSQKFQRRRTFHAAMDGTPTGRLLRYSRSTVVGEAPIVEVLATDIYMPNGIVQSHDGVSLLIVSGVSILRFDLWDGIISKTPFVEVMPGSGDNIKAMDELPNGTKKRCYWAALGGKYHSPFSLVKFLSDKPWLRSVLLAFVPYKKIIDLVPKWTALAVYDEQGRLLEMIWDDGSQVDGDGKKVGVPAPWISEMEPLGDYLYLLSWHNPFLARIDRASLSSAAN